MGKKFCPQCNRNVSVVRRNGSKCCPCCGFKADYMGPAVSEQYSASRPVSQNQTIVKPDEHDEEDRTFSRYTEIQPAFNARLYRAVTIILIITTVIMANVALYATDYTWTLDEDATQQKTETVYELFKENGAEFEIYIMSAVIFLFAFFIPRYLGVAYFFIGSITAVTFVYGVSFDSPIGSVTFLLSLVIGALIHTWEKNVCSGYLAPRAFVRAFWFNGKY